MDRPQHDASGVVAPPEPSLSETETMSQDATQEPAAEPADENKTTTIVVNATQYVVSGKEISYEQVVAIAYNNAPPTGPNVVITVTFSRGEHGREGTLLPGDQVKLKSRMVFDVSATDRS